MLIVIGSVIARPETLDELVSISQEHVARSLKEPGCQAHAVHRDLANPLRLVFVERWGDLPSLLAHFKVPESIAFARALTALVATPPEMKIYNASELPSAPS
jgi:quinol monooxygenase YgiN